MKRYWCDRCQDNVAAEDSDTGPFCRRCGRTVAQGQMQMRPVARPATADDFARYTQRPEMAAAAAYVTQLVARISREHGKQWRTCVRNGQVSGAYPSDDLIVFTWQSLERAMQQGFTEYTSIWSEAWDDLRQPKGREGLYRLALHETAHLLQEYAYRSVHNTSFVNAVRDLRILYPFS